MEYPIRIGKYLAHKGYASRRGATEMIKQGLVTINRKKAVVTDIVEERDKVAVARVSQRSYVYYAYHKPKGIISVTSDGGDESIEQRIKCDHGVLGVFPIGRLDKDSTGLIILTNDGRITGKLLDPDKKHEKEYRVTVHKPLKSNFTRLMERGVDIEGYVTKPCIVKVTGEQSFSIILTEGKKHQIRRMCMNLGYTVTRLKRVRIGAIKLGALKVGQLRKVTREELAPLLPRPV